MIQYWGGYFFTGSPQAQGRAAWPRFDTTSQFLSLRVAGQSRTIDLESFRSEHHCDFWDAVG